MLVRKWKAIQVIFTYASHTKNHPKKGRKDAKEFSFLRAIEKEVSNTSSLRDNSTNKMPPVYILWYWVWLFPIGGM